MSAAHRGDADSDDQREGDERRDLFRDIDTQRLRAAHEGGCNASGITTETTTSAPRSKLTARLPTA
jgi:hypothetical protein